MIGQQELFDFLPHMAFHQDEPVADPVSVPLYYVSKLARETELKSFKSAKGRTSFLRLPRLHILFELSRPRMASPLALPASMRRGLRKQAKVAQLLGAACRRSIARWLPTCCEARSREELFWGGAFIFDETHKRQLLTPALRDRLRAGSNGKSSE